MRRRFAISMLAGALAFASLGLCPCLAGDCSVVGMEREHRCCEARSGLRTAGCCESHLTSPGIRPVSEDGHLRARVLSSARLATAGPVSVIGAADDAVRPAEFAYPGTAPPGTLVSAHTSLLL